MSQDNQFLALQEFQKAFFTDPKKFYNYTQFEVKKHGFLLINNIGKGFPALADKILNMKGFGFYGFESFEILRALQQKIINPYNVRMPNYLFYKTEKPKKETKKTDKGLEFAPEVKREICSLLCFDNNTYEYLKYSDLVQNCGKQITGDFKINNRSNNKPSKTKMKNG